MSTSNTDTIDFQRAAIIGLSQIKVWLPNGRQDGHEWVTLNPTRNDNHLGSFKVNLVTGRWADFKTGDAGGDAVSLYAYINHINTKHPMLDAAKEILKGTGYSAPTPAHPPQESERKKPVEEWVPIVPIPMDAPEPDFDHWNYGQPTLSWLYRDESGAGVVWLARYDPPGAKKEIVPYTYCTKADGTKAWRMKNVPEPRPLYNLDKIKANPQASVLVVSGEKCADAAAMLLEPHGWIVTTHMNGDNAVEKADWSPLRERPRVLVWGDNDESGQKAARRIATILRCSTLTPPQDKPEKWDVYDAIHQDKWDDKTLLTFIDPPQEEVEKKSNRLEWPFVPLGHDHGSYFFLSSRTHEVICIEATKMGKRALQIIADLSWWETMFPGSNGADWDAASDALIALCSQAGKYDSEVIRGRGAWFDEGRAVLHMGDRIIFDGQEYNLPEFRTRYVYEVAMPMANIASQPLTRGDAIDLIEIFCRLNWTRPGMAYLMAGWCVSAIICGALPWRPHGWLTGGAGSGKSWVQDNVVKPLLGDMAIHIQGASSEAGIRQTLSCDARPVLIDEAESDEKSQRDRIQAVLTLMRQSSTEGGGDIVKGTTSGKKMTFRIRSSFLLSSINVSAKHHADESRVQVFSLERDTSPEAAEKFAKLQKLVADTLTDEYCSAFRARAITMIPTILKSYKVLRNAIATKFSSARKGDQLGILLACCHALSDDAVIQEGFVDYYMGICEESDDEIGRSGSDEEACLTTILQYQIAVKTEQGPKDATIGELIARAANINTTLDVPVHIAEQTLKRFGIRYVASEARVWIAVRSEGLRRVLAHTAWGDGYWRILKRLPGVRSEEKKMRFTDGLAMRAISIALSLIAGEE